MFWYIILMYVWRFVEAEMVEVVHYKEDCLPHMFKVVIDLSNFQLAFCIWVCW